MPTLHTNKTMDEIGREFGNFLFFLSPKSNFEIDSRTTGQRPSLNSQIYTFVYFFQNARRVGMTDKSMHFYAEVSLSEDALTSGRATFIHISCRSPLCVLSVPACICGDSSRSNNLRVLELARTRPLHCERYILARESDCARTDATIVLLEP
jgi:hypothetical protein